MTLKNSLLSAAILLSTSTVAFANAITFKTFDIYDPTGTVLLAENIDALDWAQNGSAMTEAFLNPGDIFTVRYQSYIQGYNPIQETTIPGAIGLVLPFSSGGYEITAAAEFQFEVITGGAVLGPSTFQAVAQSGTFSIFYDDATRSNTRADPLSGVGFDDGEKVMQLSLAGFDPVDGTGSSTFNLTTPGSGIGSTVLHFIKTQPGDFVMSSVFPDFNVNTEMQFDATLNRPANDSSTNGFFFNEGGDVNYPQRPVVSVNPGEIGDVVFKADGASRFGDSERTIPEPSSIALIVGGLGVLGSLSIRGRKRQTKV